MDQRAVIYSRVSTKEQTKNLSLQTQQKYCTQYCLNNGFAVDRIFIDEGESAKTTARPEFRNLIEYCRVNRGKIKAVIVYNLSRFSRNTADHLGIRALLTSFGITLRSVMEPTDDSPTGKFMETMISAMAQYENDAKAQRTKTGMKAAKECGRWTFQAPIGFLNVLDPSGKPTLTFDPVRGPFIQKAFELYATGAYSKNQVLRIVSNLGLLTRKGKKVSSQTFNKILRNRLYTGWIDLPQWGEATRGNFPPLISSDVFMQVGMVLDGKRPTITPHVRNHPDFPLRRFITCGECGKPLTGSWSKGRGKRYPYYRCPNPQCKAVNCRKEEVEQKFQLLLKRLQPREEYLRLFNAIVLDAWKEKQADTLLQRVAIENQIKTLNERKEQLIEAFVYKGAIDQTTFQVEQDKIKAQMTLAEIELNEVKHEELDTESVLNFSQYLLLNAARLWSEASLDQKQRLQGVLFPNGLSFTEGSFGIAKTCLAFNLLESFPDSDSSVVSPTGFEPVLLP